MQSIIDSLRSSWFIIIFVGGIVWWAAYQDSSMAEVKRNEAHIGALESRVSTLESGLGQMQLKIDIIKEDVTLIKNHVINN